MIIPSIELTRGIVYILQRVFATQTEARFLRTIIYTIGHILIAMTCNTLITGAAWGLAAADALIEPCINGVWFFLLDTVWSHHRNLRRSSRSRGIS